MKGNQLGVEYDPNEGLRVVLMVIICIILSFAMLCMLAAIEKKTNTDEVVVKSTKAPVSTKKNTDAKEPPQIQYQLPASNMKDKQHDNAMSDNDACPALIITKSNEDILRDIRSEISSMVSACKASQLACAGGDTQQQVVDQGPQTLQYKTLDMPDFALESLGGRIISTPYTDAYSVDSWYTLDEPLPRRTRSPRAIIQPFVIPGECWQFRGSNGTVVIQLAARIDVTAVTVEHIPSTLSLTGKLDSAPQKFSVFGLVDPYKKRGLLLGTFQYNITSSPRQTFFIQDQEQCFVEPFSAVKLWIMSNHGNPDYTCVYGFRVHGKPHSNEINLT